MEPIRSDSEQVLETLVGGLNCLKEAGCAEQIPEILPSHAVAVFVVKLEFQALLCVYGCHVSGGSVCQHPAMLFLAFRYLPALVVSFSFHSVGFTPILSLPPSPSLYARFNAYTVHTYSAAPSHAGFLAGEGTCIYYLLEKGAAREIEADLPPFLSVRTAMVVCL